MAKFRKKPVVIEAVQYHHREYADNPLVFSEWPPWLSRAIDDELIVPFFGAEDYWYLDIETLEGTQRIGPMDWIIHGIEGELYPCDQDIFQKTYEPVTD